MVRRMMYALAAAALVMNLGLQANAAEKTGSISISLDAGELPVINGAMTVYHVGSRVTEGYRIGDGFGGGIVKAEDALSPQLARWLAEAAGENGKTVLLDVDGNVTFSNLEEGLYLVVQSEKMDGFYPVAPFMLTIPCEGRWQLQVNPVPEPIVTELVMAAPPQTGQSPAPFLGLLGMGLSSLGLCLCALGRRKK